MGIYRNIQMSFWTDSKVADEMTPEDRYFYLYLLTNTHTNLAGCYELSLRQSAYETGYTKETIERLIERFEKVHRVIVYSSETKEVLILNWSKYNWTKSPKFRKSLSNQINTVKDPEFKAYLQDLMDAEEDGTDTVSIPYRYPSDTTVTVTVTDTVSNTVNNNTMQDIISGTKKQEKAKPMKHKYGEYKNVLLTDDEVEKLKADIPHWETLVEELSEYMASSGKSYKSHYATIRAWHRRKKPTLKPKDNFAETRTESLDAMFKAGMFGGNARSG